MTPAQLQTIKDALDSERQYWTTIASDPKDVIDTEVAKIAEAKAALCALVDSIRWRKQSEEPAPKGRVIWRDELHFTQRCLGRDVPAWAEWLPVPP